MISSCYQTNARAAMGIPILVFSVMCLLFFISGIRRGQGDTNVPSGGHENNGNSIVVQDSGISVGHGHHRGYRYGGGSPKKNDNDDHSFDFFIYSLSYQPEFCRENHERFVGCKDFQENWEGQLTIHGLWPSREDGTWPAMCSNEKLDTSLLDSASFSDKLEKEWPNVKASASSPGHESFWGHEWSKHGTCSGLTQQNYFETALDLLLSTPTVVKEKYGSVVNRKDLLQGDFEDAVLVCKYGYLSEVRVCFSKAMGDEEVVGVGGRMGCPETTLKEDTCGNVIKIASFSDDIQELNVV